MGGDTHDDRKDCMTQANLADRLILKTLLLAAILVAAVATALSGGAPEAGWSWNPPDSADPAGMSDGGL